MPSPRSTLAAPDSSSSSRQMSSAWPNVSSATSYAPTAASPSPSSVSASASLERSSASRASASAAIVSSRASSSTRRCTRARARPSSACRRSAVLLGIEQSERAVVMAFGREPRLDRLVALGRAHERRRSLRSRTSAGTPATGADLVDELGRGREVMRGLVDGRLAARRQHRREHRVPPGPLGLGQRAVRDLADELRLEVELVAVER